MDESEGNFSLKGNILLYTHIAAEVAAVGALFWYVNKRCSSIEEKLNKMRDVQVQLILKMNELSQHLQPQQPMKKVHFATQKATPGNVMADVMNDVKVMMAATNAMLGTKSSSANSTISELEASESNDSTPAVDTESLESLDKELESEVPELNK